MGGNTLLLTGKTNIDEKELKRLSEAFRKMMSALYKEEGASLRMELLREPEVTGFIDTHASILDTPLRQTEMSDTMRERLSQSNWMFSGLKTFHELNEAFPSLMDEKGNKKPFERFLNDVRKIDDTYNKNYLRAEYNFAGAAAQMAERWEEAAKDDEEIYLQYRTAHDGKVRPEHAELHGITLPMSDRFWDEYYPPNGWNCRCSVEKVLRFKSTPTPHEEAMKRAEKVFRKDKKGMFKFNPGKEQRTFPAYNPYTISKCRTCDKSNLSLAKGDGIPQNQLCSACRELRSTRELGSLLKRIDKTKGREYIDLLKLITTANEFKPYKDSKGIFYAGGENDKDFDNLINAARKAASIGYDVYLLPNIKDCRTSDYILVKKGFIDRFDLKTITGKNSVSNRLKESVGQTDRVILNMTVKYNARKLAGEIKNYFEMNDTAKSVMVFKGNRCVIVYRSNIDKNFTSMFRKEYSK